MIFPALSRRCLRPPSFLFSISFLLSTPIFLTGCPQPEAKDAGPALDAGASNNDAGPIDAGTMDAGTMDAGTIDAGPIDAGPIDAGPIDAGTMDAGTIDAGTMDAGTIDAGVGVAGFGFLSGACDVVSAELNSSAPSLFTNHIDFGGDPYTEGTDYASLTSGGQEIIDDGNAGGSSIFSEVFSFEVLARCENALLLKTETEVVYDVPGKITDLLVEIDGQKVGVSVTRAVGFPRDDPYTLDDANNLLVGKLEDVLQSSANVAAEDAWVKQILHVIAFGPAHAASIADAWALIDDNIRADTLVFVTVSDGDDDFLY